MVNDVAKKNFGKLYNELSKSGTINSAYLVAKLAEVWNIDSIDDVAE